jgi:phthiocerol/phenolphthiocerol synthesis type-I polyketide synthase E
MRDRSLDVAVTGLSARLPGPTETEKWWAAVCSGDVLTSSLDPHALAAAGVPPHVLADPRYVPVRGCVADSERFDAELFGISPREAELIDPQHRLMLEATWAALEDAGRNPLDDTLRTAVFASSSTSRYLARILGNPAASADTLEALAVGTGRDFMAARIAYRLGLRGPALSVLTACSSSLVAVHLAVQALNSGDCDQAVVVAASVGFPQGGYVHVPGGIMSVDGRCRPFDAEATGTVGGSGVVAVVLRRFEDVHDDVRSHGVILGSAVNNDGSAKAGFNAPSPHGQAAVIRAALRSGDVPADSLGYVEAHGTGTYVGDPIEWTSMSGALRDGGALGPIPVGSVKANIGHLDAAAGLASLVKVLLVLKHGQVPPVANFGTLNPLLADVDSPLYVPTTAEEWLGPTPRRAGISSFGIGGTNAHVIVEQAPAAPTAPAAPAASERGEHARSSVVVLSAVRPSSLDRSAVHLAEHLTDLDADVDVADVAHTLRAARPALAERLAVVGRSGAEVAEALLGGTRQVRGRAPADGPRPLVFLLPGQGAQRPGMARPFLAQLPGFDSAMEDCLRVMDPSSAATVRSALLDRDLPGELLRETRVAQPALFTLEYAAAQALIGLGLRPAALAGHSLGEVTSACLAGVLDLEAAIGLVRVRAAAMQSCPAGAMVALSCPPEDALGLLPGSGLDLAAVNSPVSCVLSGPVAAVEALEHRISGRVPFQRLRTSHAFHSAAMEPAAAALRRHLAGLGGGSATVPFLSNADGSIVPAGTAVPPTVFAHSLRSTVRFADGIAELRRRFPDALAVEVGPGQALTGTATAAGLDALPLSPGRRDSAGGSGHEVALALADLWVRGQPVDLAALAPAGRLLHLPGTVFGGDRHIAPETAWQSQAPSPTASPPSRASAPGGTGGPSADPGDHRPVPLVEVKAAWRDLLGHQDLTEDADFVAVGGDSLTAIRLSRRLEQTFAVEVPLRDLLLARTLGDQAHLVERLMTPSDTEAPHV